MKDCRSCCGERRLNGHVRPRAPVSGGRGGGSQRGIGRAVGHGGSAEPVGQRDVVLAQRRSDDLAIAGNRANAAATARSPTGTGPMAADETAG